MSGIVLRSIYNAALKRHIPIELATELRDYNRLPDTIDENLKKIALDLTERAFNKLSPGYQANIQKIIITYGSSPTLEERPADRVQTK